MSFSVLLPVYAGDRPGPLRRALASATVDQTLRPDQLVIVEDGPLTAELDAVLDAVEDACPVPVTRVRLPHNVRLARALEAGLARCDHDIVARADADDICLPERFARQIPLVEDGCDLVGSAIAEFRDDSQLPAGNGVVRSRPATHAAIVRYAHFHSPFNHPSVVFRRSAVEAAGGYQELDFMEDYWLFLRMLVNGARTANVEDVLVMYRADAAMYARRGRSTLRSDWVVQLRALRLGFLTPAETARNLALRTVYRLVPSSVRRFSYTHLLARSR